MPVQESSRGMAVPTRRELTERGHTDGSWGMSNIGRVSGQGHGLRGRQFLVSDLGLTTCSLYGLGQMNLSASHLKVVVATPTF